MINLVIIFCKQQKGIITLEEDLEAKCNGKIRDLKIAFQNQKKKKRQKQIPRLILIFIFACNINTSKGSNSFYITNIISKTSF